MHGSLEDPGSTGRSVSAIRRDGLYGANPLA